MLRTLLRFYQKTKMSIGSGVALTKILSLPVREELSRLKILPSKEFDKANMKLNKEMDEQFEKLSSGESGSEQT